MAIISAMKICDRTEASARKSSLDLKPQPELLLNYESRGSTAMALSTQTSTMDSSFWRDARGCGGTGADYNVVFGAKAHLSTESTASHALINKPDPHQGGHPGRFQGRSGKIFSCLSSSAGGEPNHMTTDIFVDMSLLFHKLSQLQKIVTQRGIENRSQITSNFTTYSGPWGCPVCHLISALTASCCTLGSTSQSR